MHNHKENCTNVCVSGGLDWRNSLWQPERTANVILHVTVCAVPWISIPALSKQCLYLYKMCISWCTKSLNKLIKVEGSLHMSVRQGRYSPKGTTTCLILQRLIRSWFLPSNSPFILHFQNIHPVNTMRLTSFIFCDCLIFIAVVRHPFYVFYSVDKKNSCATLGVPPSTSTCNWLYWASS